jgi:type VII secretion protein EccE
VTGTRTATKVAVQVYEARPGGQRRGRGWWVRIGRGRLIALEAAVGAAVTGGILLGAVGSVMILAAGLVLVLALGRRDGRWLTELVAAQIRRDAATRVVVAGESAVAPATGEGAGGSAAELGAVAGVVPCLVVVECTDRNGYPLGVAWDGQGFAAALELDTRTPVRLDLGRLAAYAAEDDVPLAGVQLLIEQVGVPPQNERSAPTPHHHSPAPDLPLLRRAWVTLRYEPIWAPGAARRRGGGGADGARLAVSAALARLRVRLLGHGLAAAPLDAAGLTRTLRTVGDPAPTGTLHRDCWTTTAAQHHCLGATVASTADWSALLHAASHSLADRTVLSLAVELDGHSIRTRAALRLVSANHAAARQARQRLLAADLVSPLPGGQAAGLLATLPLGGGPHPLTGAIGWIPR